MRTWLQDHRESLIDAGLLILRIALGVCMIVHGAGKFLDEKGIAGFASFLDSIRVPAPAIMAPIAAGTELVGGALLVVGLLTRLACLGLAIDLLVAAVGVHAPHGYLVTNQPVMGMEYPLNLAITFLAIMLMGPGRISLDHLLFSRRAERTADVHEFAETGIR